MSDLSSVFCKKVGDFFEIGVGKPYKIRAEDSEKLLSLNGGLGAVIVPRAGWSEEQIRRGVERLNQKRTVFLRIRHIWLRKEKLPRTSTGKLKRFCLEQEYGKGEINGTSV